MGWVACDDQFDIGGWGLKRLRKVLEWILGCGYTQLRSVNQPSLLPSYSLRGPEELTKLDCVYCTWTKFMAWHCGNLNEGALVSIKCVLNSDMVCSTFKKNHWLSHTAIGNWRWSKISRMITLPFVGNSHAEANSECWLCQTPFRVSYTHSFIHSFKSSSNPIDRY